MQMLQYMLGIMIDYVESNDQVDCKLHTQKLKSCNNLTTLRFLSHFFYCTLDPTVGTLASAFLPPFRRDLYSF